MESLNAQVAARLDDVADILAEQGANPYRVRAYRRGAETLRWLERPVSELLQQGGMATLEALPGIGPSLARAIRDLALTGRLPMLERLRGDSDPISLLMTVPGVGRLTAERIHHELDIETLEELEAAAHDGRLDLIAGIGRKRVAGIRDSLASRLARVRSAAPVGPDEEPSVSELLEVDAEYRAAAKRGSLQTIAPRRFNPTGEAWLPVLHTHRGERHYTAMFSNSPRAHRLGATRDWVVLLYDTGRGEHQATVITARRGPLAGLRIVRGRERECAELSGLAPPEVGLET